MLKVVPHIGTRGDFSFHPISNEFKQQDNGVLHVNALILVERNSQKSIIIGKQGARLKQIGRDARLDMEEQFGQRVFLEIWVKVKDGWADDERALKSLGYEQE